MSEVKNVPKVQKNIGGTVQAGDVKVKTFSGRKTKTRNQRDTSLIRKTVKNGDKISRKRVDEIKTNMKAVEREMGMRAGKYYVGSFNEQNCGNRRMIILFAAGIRIIKGKLGMPKKTANYWIRSVAMAREITDNTSTYFTPAFSGLALWTARNLAMDTAIKNRALKLLGSAGALKTAKANLKISLDAALVYVNGLARGNQDNAVAIITAALMVVIEFGTRTKEDFSIYQGTASGQVVLDSLILEIDGKQVKTSYEHEYSVTPAEPRVWLPLISSAYSKCTKEGMATGIKTYIRRRRNTKKGGIADWSVVRDITLE